MPPLPPLDAEEPRHGEDAPGEAVSSSLLGPVEIRDLAEQFGIRPSKSRGQNFLHDANTVRRIVGLARVDSTSTVLEVGPGLGSLTLGLLQTGARVVAVEIDRGLAAGLRETVLRHQPGSADRLRVVHADALRLGDAELAVEGSWAPDVLAANLPYNIAVPLLLRLLETVGTLDHGVVMMQREVAQRLTAPAGSRVYGAPTVKLAWYAHAKSAGPVGRRVFWPEPRVDSALVEFRRVRPPEVDEETRRCMFDLVGAAFAQRRKTLRSALAPALGGPAGAEDVLRAAGLDPTLRGEALTCEDFLRLARAAQDLRP